MLDQLRQISHITGATVRAINQIGNLITISRRGQTAHAPMRLPRRLHLVDAALAQLSQALGLEAHTAIGLGLLTDQIRAAWAARAIKQPLPPAFPRNLFDWAWPEPVNLADEDLIRQIQTHPDIAYVEKLRAERHRRGLATGFDSLMFYL